MPDFSLWGKQSGFPKLHLFSDFCPIWNVSFQQHFSSKISWCVVRNFFFEEKKLYGPQRAAKSIHANFVLLLLSKVIWEIWDSSVSLFLILFMYNLGEIHKNIQTKIYLIYKFWTSFVLISTQNFALFRKKSKTLQIASEKKVVQP